MWGASAPHIHSGSGQVLTPDAPEALQAHGGAHGAVALEQQVAGVADRTEQGGQSLGEASAPKQTQRAVDRRRRGVWATITTAATCRCHMCRVITYESRTRQHDV